MSAAAKLKEPVLLALRRRLDRWELEHLRAHSAQLAERCEYLEDRAVRAEDMAESWREDAMRLVVESLQDGDAPGLTPGGHLGIVKGPAASQTPALPAIGATWQGGLYAGITTNAKGEAYALVLLGDKPAAPLTWQKARDWATSLGSDADLPTRVEGALLFTNLRDQFEQEWHWTNEQHAADESYAWFQYFYYGFQHYYVKSYEGRVRAVRRFPIDPSILFGGAA